MQNSKTLALIMDRQEKSCHKLGFNMKHGAYLKQTLIINFFSSKQREVRM